MTLHPAWLAGAAALAVYLVVRRRQHGKVVLAAGWIAVVGAALIGTGVIELPNIEKLLADAGNALGKWTYLLVGLLAYLETGAFIGLVAPGETTVIVGGVVAGQGEISLLLLIGIVWTCAVLGDLTSYALGRRLGREFLLRHGGRVKITEERLEQVEGFFDRRGGSTILVGRFIGLVRAIAPFVAGSAHMPLRKFLPYDVLGAGLWSVTFCLLGYIFWRSFDQLTTWVSRGLFAFAVLAALVVGIVFLVRLQRSPELQARTRAWIAEQLERPALRPVAPFLRTTWRRVVRPGLEASETPARFVAGRFTPGELGLQATTLLALAAVGGFAFVLMGDALSHSAVLPFDRAAFTMADRLYAEPLKDVAVVVSALGSFLVLIPVVLLTAGTAAMHRRGTDALFLIAAFVATAVAVEVAKPAFARPRPVGSHVATEGFSFPSGHAANAVAWIGCAVVLARCGNRFAARFAIVSLSVVLTAAIGLSRIYLRANHLSDVEAGAALAVALYSLLGLAALVVYHLRHNVALRR